MVKSKTTTLTLPNANTVSPGTQFNIKNVGGGQVTVGSYIGNGQSQSVSHGLGFKPSMVMIKNSGGNWNQHHSSKPQNPVEGDVYMDSATNQINVFTNGSWQIVSSAPPIDWNIRQLQYELDIVTQDGIYVLEIYSIDDVTLMEKDPVEVSPKEPDELLEQEYVAEGRDNVLSFLKERMGVKEYSWVEKKFFEMV